jgi:hypothetical protein
MKETMDKIAVVFVAAIFALTGAAAGYAMWSQELTIDGNVQTGTVDWEWVQDLTVSDPFCPPPYIPDNPLLRDKNCDPDWGFFELEDGQGWGPNWVDKNVGCGNITKIDEHTLEITITNAYPGYWNGIETPVHGVGTIPIKIQEAIFSWDPEGTNVIAIINKLNEGKVIHIDLDGNGSTDMELIWGDHFGDQLELCVKWEISWEICFLQTLQQDQTYTFYVTLHAVQWNEYVAP